MDADQRFADAVALFDEGRYFECHEVLEELWKADPSRERDFYRGLLQLGVSLHKARLGKLAGARSLFAKGRARLAPFGARHRGVEIERLIREVEAWLDEAEARVARGLDAWPEGAPPRIGTLARGTG